MLSAENRTSGVTNNRPGSGHGGLVTSKISSLIQEAEAKSGLIGVGGGKRKSSAGSGVGGGMASNENLNLLQRRQSPLGSEQNSAAAASADNVPKLPPKPGRISGLLSRELQMGC